MKWFTIIFAALLPLNVASFEVTDFYPFVYLSDPLIDRERANQSPRLFWEPAQSIDESVHQGLLDLKGGESASFMLAAQSHLRLQLKTKQDLPTLWLSRDGQLWWQASWTPGNEGQEWFYVDKRSSPLLARLEAVTNFRARLLIAKREYVDSPSAYRQIALPSRFEQLKLNDAKGETLVVQRLAPGEIFEAEVEGPTVLALVTRPDETQEDHQEYSLSWTLNGAPWQQVGIERSQLSTNYQKVGAAHLHGAMDRHYLTISEGRQQLKLKASISVLVSLEKAKGDYFLDFNAPRPTTAELTEGLLNNPISAGSKTLMELDLLRQSNHIEGSADIALAYLQQDLMDSDQKVSWPGASPQLVQQSLAANIERSQRFFRNLFPDAGTETLTLNTAWFATTSPLELEADGRYYLKKGVLERVSRGLFVYIGKDSLTYTLPERFGPSHLRLSIVPSSALKDTALWIQYDDAPAQRLTLTESVLPTDLLLPEDVLLSQDALEGQPRLYPTLNGEFNSEKDVGHYWPVNSVILPLPADVGKVRVWSDASHSVALQYRASQAYMADEKTYKGLLEQITPDSSVKLLHQALETVSETESEPLMPGTSPARALTNQWYPMLRYLHASQAAYLDDFNAMPPAGKFADFSTRLQKAGIEVQRGHWIGVLEALGKTGYGYDPQAYRWSQKALKTLGEHYLAGRQQQASAVFAPNMIARRLATDDLMAEYAKTQRWESQISLLAARFLREGDSQFIAPLGEALHRAGYAYWASQLGVLVARDKQLPAWLPEAAQEAGWFDTASSGQDRQLSLGDLAAGDGKNNIAIKHWNKAGPEAITRMTRMFDAQSIAKALDSSDQAQRLAGIEQWIKWALSPQQHFDWVSLGDRLENSRGFSTLFSGVTRKPLSLPHASMESPVEVEVIGPAVLRVQLRALGIDNHDFGKIDWLTAEFVDVSGKTTSTIAPISNFGESLYLKSVEDDIRTATGNDILLEVPAGLHRVRLRPQKHDYLTQIWQWAPTNSWAVLPPLTPLTLKSMLQTPEDSSGVLVNTAPEFLHVRDGALQPLPALPPRMLYTLDFVSQKTPVANHILESVKFPSQVVAPEGWPEGSYAVQLQNIDIHSGMPESAEAAYALAVALLWNLEQNPELLELVSARLGQIASAFSENPMIGQLAGSLLQGYDWQHISSSFESAGLRQLPLLDQMQSPFRRVRQALLDNLPSSATLLTGRAIEGVELFTPDPLNVDINLAQLVLPHEARITAEVMIQLDDNQPQSVSLGENEASIQLRLQPGEHALRLWLKNPRQQQFVSAQFNRAESLAPLLEDETRSFHIAAPDQPASFYVKGPAWVRVDEWTPENHSTEYQYVDEGWQSLTLRAGHQEDRYYRLYTLKPSVEANKPLEPVRIEASLAVPSIATAPSIAAMPIAWKTEDLYPPGNGLNSWGGYLGLVERVAGSEDDVVPAQGSNLMEAGVSFRFRQQERRLFGRSDLFMRRFEGGQELLGAKQWLDLYSEDNHWLTGFFGEAYFQPERIAGLGDNHWAVRLQGSIERTFELSPRLKHEPGITFNQRWMSLDAVPFEVLSELDPDVYSPYKDDHRRSLIFSDRLTWTPHHDQRAYLEGALVTNESLSPFDFDHLEVTTAVKQLFGSVAGEAGLRWRRYFNDDDRDTSLDRSRVFVGADVIRWGTGKYALTLRGEASYDIERNGFGWILRVGFENNAGHMSSAKRPDELDFLQLRRSQQREYIETNHLEPVYP